MTTASALSPVDAQLRAILARRIMILDGAMGTIIQQYKLDEAAYRGARFADFAAPAGSGARELFVKGNNELLNLTQPQVIQEIHERYLAAGADLIETNTFGATSIAQDDYHMAALVHEMNLEAAKLARAACDKYSTPDKPRFVAGALGPTPKTASISPDVNDPAARNVSFDQLVAAYHEQVSALVEGGVDLLLVETIFDTLNCKAALFAIDQYFDAHPATPRLPLMISGTVTDASGRILSGQTVPAFWNSVRHAKPLTIGLNCALGAALMRPYAQELSKIADTFVSIYPNAGLPNPMSDTGFDELPADTSGLLREFAESGFVNVAGGCCGTTPEHIKAIADAMATIAPRAVPTVPTALRLSGLEPFTIDDDSLFVNVGERTNVTGSKAFARMILNEQFDEALSVARQQVENGAQVIDINMDEAMLDSQAAMTRFLNLIASEPDISRVPIMIDSSKWSVIEAGLKCVQGKAIVNSISMKEGEDEFIRQAKLCRRYGAAVIVMAFDEQGPGRHLRAQDRDLRARLRRADRAGRLPAGRHHLRPEHLRDRHRHRGAQQLRGRLHRRHALDPREPAAREGVGRRVQRVVLVPRQRPGARSHPHRVPVPRDQGRHDDGDRQRRHGRRLRRPGARAARARRGRGAEPPRGRHRAHDRIRRHAESRRQQAGSQPGMARSAGRQAPGARARARHHPVDRRGHRGSARSRSRQPAAGRSR